METPSKPGLYPGVSFADYIGWSLPDYSLLKKFDKSPAHARHSMLNPIATSSTDVGQAIHAATFEPDAFEQDYVVPPKVDRRTKIGKATWSTFVADNPTKIHLTSDEWERLTRSAESALSNLAFREILKSPHQSELSGVFRCPYTDRLVKVRLDLFGSLAGYPLILDLKSTKDADPRHFGRTAVAVYGYHEQAATYLLALERIAADLHGETTPVVRRSMILAVDTSAPFCAAMLELDDEALAQGLREYRRHILAFDRCDKSGDWPGYPEGIHPISLPTYKIDRDETDYRTEISPDGEEVEA